VKAEPLEKSFIFWDGRDGGYGRQGAGPSNGSIRDLA
jgi:hypothetical protein